MTGFIGELRQQRAVVAFGLAALGTWLLFESDTTNNVAIWVEHTRAALVSLVQLHPLAAIVGVWVGGRPRALGTRELEARAVRSHPLVALRPLLVSIATIAAGYLTVVAVWWGRALVRLAGRADLSVVDGVVLLVAMVTIASWTLLGAVVAQLRAPRWVLAPLVGVVAWLHPVFLEGPATSGLAQVPANLWMPQGAWNWTRVGTALLFAIALTGFMAALLAVTVDRQRNGLLAAGAAAVVVVVAGSLVVSAGTWRFSPGPDELPAIALLDCRSVGAATVCVHPAHAAFFDERLPELRQQVGDRADTPMVAHLDVGFGVQPFPLEPGVVGMGMQVTNGHMSLPDDLGDILVRGEVDPSRRRPYG